ncbi:tape measure protein [Mediterraneibacter gnavus]|uniref:Tape measure domain protein n=1 Tax=Mediterraneibacter gnavus (strain ATCC 29149 / DSM 114966 / JCM 6515 / VPI C7-9) TaxID=411470 RepID=A7B3U7_MEDG7|nr:tape measure protein [Mediterraneibacter gnavus]EDN77623.1 tape measure domain protein [Mediterraneibacter gnavus ATCC 29149]PQL33302.1 tape measure domain-containing protein [Mediterraneibacter gnavus ATCC 29149]QEI32426.1 tape measure protein [Mediterraneibacter gnavus ATCC 29149]QHB24920.1 tape measure domain-containing protein [Mediterraneibacter gnavus ATCC 29149]UZT20191.1 tape measure protein [Mediterraneibacter gnavus]
MGYDGSLKFDTEINESGFNSGISKLGGIAKKGAGVAVAAVGAVTAALGAGVVAGVKYNASIESYQTSFEVMTGSAEKAAEVIDKLKKVGAETPFELPDLADTTQLLMNYGFSADEAMDKMMMLGDISQGSADKMSRIATAYGQMSSAGKVYLEDVKQMIEAGFNPLQEISESTGESMASLYDRISKGTISVDEITASMQRATSEGGKYFQSMEKQSQTFSGLISTLKDNAQQLLGEVVKPISDGLTESLLPAAISAIEQLTQGFEENGVSGMIQAAGNIVNGLFAGIMENAPLLISTGMELLNQFLLGIATGIPTLLTKGFEIVTQLTLGILQNLPQLITQGAAVITNFVNGLLSSLPSVLQSGVQMILRLVDGIINNLPAIISAAAQAIARFIASIASNLPQILSTGIKIIGELASGLIRAIPNLVGKIPQIISAIKDAFLSVDWLSVGVNIIKGIASGVASAAGQLVDAAVGAATDALNWVKSKLGIHSPSRVFRDQVGKNMALGIGVGFEDNIPYKDMEKQANKMVSRIQGAALGVTTSASPTASGYVASRSAVRTTDNGELLYAVDRLSRLANRPLEIINKIDSVETSRVLATPMEKQIEKNSSFRKMLGGDRN